MKTEGEGSRSSHSQAPTPTPISTPIEIKAEGAEKALHGGGAGQDGWMGGGASVRRCSPLLASWVVRANRRGRSTAGTQPRICHHTARKRSVHGQRTVGTQPAHGLRTQSARGVRAKQHRAIASSSSAWGLARAAGRKTGHTAASRQGRVNREYCVAV